MSRETDDILETLEKHWPEGSKTIRSHIAQLEKVAVHAQFYLKGLPDADGYELDDALRAAGYLEEPVP
jgi:hypothetical protein